jgi:hypothetical protein
MTKKEEYAGQVIFQDKPGKSLKSNLNNLYIVTLRKI